jgi:hypothetical protein
MRVMFVVVALAGLLGGMPTGEARAWYPWCARYVAGVQSDCSYVSHQQCMLTVSAVSGFCAQNPAPPPLLVPPPRHVRRRPN